MIIDFTRENLYYKGEDSPTIDLKVSIEIWWYSLFWKDSLFTVLLIWTAVYIGFVFDGYYNFEDDDEGLPRHFWTSFDKFFIPGEYFNHGKDCYYFLFYDHTLLFTFLLAQPLIIVPIIAYTFGS